MSKVDLKDPANWIPRELYEKYLAERSDKLLAYYDRAVQKRRLMNIELEWVALLAIPAWLAYRRQWAMWAAFTGVFAVATLVEVLLNIELPPAAFAGASIGLGLQARGFLLSSATGEYLRLKQQGLPPSAIEAKLSGKAKPSLALALAGLLGAVAIVVGIAYLPI